MPSPVADDHPETDPPGFWQLTALGEPFRLLFPVGVLLGAVGIILWPFYWVQWLAVYPAIPHQRIMIEGFMTAFVIGFLTTALPRLLGASRVSLRETLALAALLVLLSVFHLAKLTLAGDLTFAATLLLLFGILGRRIRQRDDNPPPGFVLVGLGLLLTLAGACLVVGPIILPIRWPGFVYALGPLLLYQSYLLPIMGVGAFLIPRFYGLPPKSDFPESRQLPPGWLREAGFAAGYGAVILAGFLLEAAGWLRLGPGLRAAAFLLYFHRNLPKKRSGQPGGTLGSTLHIAAMAVPLAYLLMALWPQWRMAWLHLLFITGFNLLTFVIASRVLLGHSGQSHRFRARLVPVIVMATCLIIAFVARAGAEWVPQGRLPHLGYAAFFWLLGTGVWAAALLPCATQPDAD
ncbi:MAG TPA: NnrS family protein [Chthoniobacteraceae bacterium]|nr:NnrS family protein [Chthoniobacteraceae bacterium]